MQPFYAYLKSWLESKYPAQVDIARALDEKNSNVSRWLNGAVAISPDVAAKFLLLADRQEERDALVIAYLSEIAANIHPSYSNCLQVTHRPLQIPGLDAQENHYLRSFIHDLQCRTGIAPDLLAVYASHLIHFRGHQLAVADTAPHPYTTTPAKPKG